VINSIIGLEVSFIYLTDESVCKVFILVTSDIHVAEYKLVGRNFEPRQILCLGANFS
jgi:hypothetical protein